MKKQNLLPYNYKKMERVFRAKPESFVQKGFTETVHEDGLRSYFKDNGADILAVAHLDSVEGPEHFKVVHLSHRSLLFSPVLDDRLGVYLITDLLPKLGVECDVLLTEGEEVGKSTAEHFETEKKYNWMFQFDRGGYDVVLYQYENDEICTSLIQCGFEIGFGAFSDISYLGHLGCRGINFGVCYNDYHSLDAWADLTRLSSQLERFIFYYTLNKERHFLYDEGTDGYSTNSHRYSLIDTHQDLPGYLNWIDEVYSYDHYRCARCSVEVNSQLIYDYCGDEAFCMIEERLCENCYFGSENE
jgi:hypothetical protein